MPSVIQTTQYWMTVTVGTCNSNYVEPDSLRHMSVDWGARRNRNSRLIPVSVIANTGHVQLMTMVSPSLYCVRSIITVL
jgi:hypothetical protein